MFKVTALDGDDKRVVELIGSEVQDIVREWAQGEIAQVAHQDMDVMEQSVQALLRLVGGLVMGMLVEASVARQGDLRPVCPHCGRLLRLVDQRRKRDMQGLVGEFAFVRPYYQCRSCGGGQAPTDDRLGIGAGRYTPALSRVAAAAATEVPFERAALNLGEVLGTTFCEADIYRVAEALGVVAESEIQADMAASQVGSVPLAPAGDTLLIGVDGTTSFIDGDWHEVKAGVVGVLGPEVHHDDTVGRDLLKAMDLRYCAAVQTDADAFFPRVLLLARQAGFGHPNLRRIVCIADGGTWIWKRMPQFDQEGVERIEILDYYHVSEHVWQVGNTFYGQGTLDAHAWVRPVLEGLLEQGPESLIDALNGLRPRSRNQKTELRKAKDYFHDHLDRMRYPRFMAMQLPIASGVVEATCRSVVCQRTKGAGMRWTRAGAQAILDLRCLHLSNPGRWRDFFARHPLRRAPHIAALRRPQTQVA